MESQSISMDRCLQGKSAPCANACPFHLNTRDFIEKLNRGNFGAARRVYTAAVLFPGIVSSLCPAPCMGPCGDHMEQKPISLRELERAAVAHGSARNSSYYAPPQDKTVAVVGGDLAGCAFAVRMAAKAYKVTLLEPSDTLCQSVRGLVPDELLQGEAADAVSKNGIRLSLCCPPAADLCRDFDVIYVSPGYTVPFQGGNVFAARERGGVIEDMAGALDDVAAVEWFLKTGNWKREEEAHARAAGTMPPAAPDSPAPDKAWARQEAARCQECDCTICTDNCVLLRQYGASPHALANDVGLSLNIFPETQGRAGMREIGSCSDCGLCKQLCPVGIDIGKMLIQARTELRQKNILPPAHHAYWLRDMSFADSDAAAVYYLPEQRCRYLFFPGCQAGGSDPRYVIQSYEKLRELWPDTGICLRCCGAPAIWSGDTDLAAREHNAIRGLWEQAGKPEVLLSCPSCWRMFREHLPEIPARMLYTLPELRCPPLPEPLEAAVFDPCASRGQKELQASVRRLAQESGAALTELTSSGDKAQCCSWGGHGYAVNPLFVHTQAQEQCALADVPYIAYCTNCRDIFTLHGKTCYHILDLWLGLPLENRPAPTITQRRENRRAVKDWFVQHCGVAPAGERRQAPLNITLSDALAQKLSEDLILMEDVEVVIRYSEAHDHYLLDAESGHRISHLRRGYITYWAEYIPEGAGYRLVNAYSHRMRLKHDTAVGEEDVI